MVLQRVPARLSLVTHSVTNSTMYLYWFFSFLSHCPYSVFLTLVCWDHLLSKPSPKTLSQVPLLREAQVRQLILEVVLESTLSTWDSGTPLTSGMAIGTPLWVASGGLKTSDVLKHPNH